MHAIFINYQRQMCVLLSNYMHNWEETIEPFQPLLFIIIITIIIIIIIINIIIINYWTRHLLVAFHHAVAKESMYYLCSHTPYSSKFSWFKNVMKLLKYALTKFSL